MMLLIVSATSFSQQINPSKPFTHEDYLQKSKNQKIISWILLGGGMGMVITGSATYKLQFTGSFGGVPLQDDHPNNTLSNILVGTGLAAMIVSIPFFVSAHRNKKKGLSLSFKNETTPQIKNSSLVYQPMPAVSLKIRL